MKQKPLLIAEIGINHNGDIKLAKKLIDLAKKAKNFKLPPNRNPPQTSDR